MTGAGSIDLTRLYPQPPATVWRHLTEPALIARWWAPCDLRAAVGVRFTFDMGTWGVQQAEVTDVVPERSLAYTFAPGRLDTLITWTLAPAGAGTALTLRHDGFDLGSFIARAAHAGLGKGWPGILERLAARLAAAEAAPPAV